MQCTKSPFSLLFLSCVGAWDQSCILFHQKQTQNPLSGKSFSFSFCFQLHVEVLVLANPLPCKCFCPRWFSDPAWRQICSYINTWEINSWPRWVCVSIGIYFGLVFRVKPNLEAASDRFSEILLLSASFSSCLALRHRKDQGMCPWTPTDWSEWLTRSEFRWSVLPASLNKPHTALPPRQHPRWHFLSPSSRSGSLGRSTLCCGSGVTQVTSWFLQEQWQPVGKDV